MDTSVAIAVILACEIDEPCRKRSKWCKDWYMKREQYGHVNLLKELRAKEPEDYRNFLRMDETAFDELLNLVQPFATVKVMFYIPLLLLVRTFFHSPFWTT